MPLVVASVFANGLARTLQKVQVQAATARPIGQVRQLPLMVLGQRVYRNVSLLVVRKGRMALLWGNIRRIVLLFIVSFSTQRIPCPGPKRVRGI